METSIQPIRNSAKAIIIEDNCLLVLKCIVNGEIFYQLPGGGQQIGEPLDDALRRECLEEISAEVEVVDLLFVRDYIGRKYSPNRHQVEFMFSCKLADGAKCSSGSEPDKVQIGIEWLPLDQLNEYNLYPHALVPILIDGRGENGPVYLGDVE